MPDSSWMSRMRSRIWAWTVTSRAVVGSSAMRRAGLRARAMAMTTRWRMPPLSWWGYSLKRISGEGMRTRRRTSMERSRASAGEHFSWRRKTSESWRPMEWTGLRAVMGSWKIMPMRRARSEQRRASEALARSSSSRRMEPVVMTPEGWGRSRMMDMAVTLLPQPDSPTRPVMEPRGTSKEMWSTAVTKPSSVWNPAEKSRMLRMGLMMRETA